MSSHQLLCCLQDILNVVKRRASFKGYSKVVVVQGDGGSESVTELADFNTYGKVDAIILSRGGGSIEDLWALTREV